MIKEDIRKDALIKRKTIKYNNKEILDILKYYIKDDFKYVSIYYPLKDELDLRFLENIYQNICFLYPKIVNDNIEFFKGYNFKKGPFDIYEPHNNELIDKKDIDLIIVPALAVNKDNYRVGYGKGYYDRYLYNYTGNTITIISDKLVYDFKEDLNDIKINEVILCKQPL